jgi:hypothetical protein
VHIKKGKQGKNRKIRHRVKNAVMIKPPEQQAKKMPHFSARHFSPAVAIILAGIALTGEPQFLRQTEVVIMIITYPYHATKPRESSFTKHFVQPQILNEAKKMQISQSANPAQTYQNQKSGVTFVILFSLALFLAYAVNNHLVTDAFSYCMALLFENFSIKNGSIYSDIALLIFFLLALFGLYCVFKFFLPIAITVLIIGVIAWLFLAPESDKPHEVKIKSGEKFERVYGG